MSGDFTTLLVGKPLNILFVSAVLLLGVWGLRATPFGIGRRGGPLLIAGLAWLLYAAWEWLVLRVTPEADMRVDLLIIWPVLGVLTVWGIVRAALPPKPPPA
jgi:hypothetical protein